MISCIEEGRRKRALLNALKENTPENITKRYKEKVERGDFLVVKKSEKNTDGLDLTNYKCIKELRKRGYKVDEIVEITEFKRHTINNVLKGIAPKMETFKGRYLSINCIESLKLIALGFDNDHILSEIKTSRPSLNAYRYKYKNIIQELREDYEVDKG